jgi:hypothetical protein
VSEYIRDADHLDDTQEMHATVELILDGIDARITAARRRRRRGGRSRSRS